MFARTSCAQPAASQTATSACSTRHSISAHMCLMAWKLPICLPNCSRTLAYSTAVCSAHRATPTASAESVTTDRSAITGAGRPTGRTAAPCSVTVTQGREKSVAFLASTATPASAQSTSTQPSGTGASKTPSAVPPNTAGNTPEASPSAMARFPVSASPAVRSPAASGGTNSSCPSAASTTATNALVATGPGTNDATPKMPSSASPTYAGPHPSGSDSIFRTDSMTAALLAH
ncbi:Uncharacterised protein [Mycobacteroides abscessus subsp. abscessus]|nr:Uncharacterised protein [Mycobacteroides abscessus subsp. abscessus]